MTFKNSCKCEPDAPYVFNPETKSWTCAVCNTVMEVSVCRTGCETQNHNSYWDCLQSANILIDRSSLRP